MSKKPKYEDDIEEQIVTDREGKLIYCSGVLKLNSLKVFLEQYIDIGSNAVEALEKTLSLEVTMRAYELLGITTFFYLVYNPSLKKDRMYIVGFNCAFDENWTKKPSDIEHFSSRVFETLKQYQDHINSYDKLDIDVDAKDMFTKFNFYKESHRVEKPIENLEEATEIFLNSYKYKQFNKVTRHGLVVIQFTEIMDLLKQATELLQNTPIKENAE